MESERTSKRRLGPGMLVAAAFIGPGTVVTASKAGAEFGLGLLWAIVFAAVGAIVLQSFAARLGILARSGLGEYLHRKLRPSPFYFPVVLLVVAALGIGNAAYQTGNLLGAAAGLSSLMGGPDSIWVAALMVLATVVLSIGKYQRLQSVLVGLVAILALAFLATAAFSLPSFQQIKSVSLIPRLTSENVTLAIALIGTTIVPYNLFLHASSAHSHWRDSDRQTALRDSWWDTVISISLGAVITAAILLTAHKAFFLQGESFTSIAGISGQLSPVLGDSSALAFSVGVFAAGLTSSITAPLATAYAVCGIVGLPCTLKSNVFRSIAIGVVFIGGLFAMLLGKSPDETIVVAQVANGVLLPIIAFVLLWASSRGLGGSNSDGDGDIDTRPTEVQRLNMIWLTLGWTVTALVSLLAAWKIFSALT